MRTLKDKVTIICICGLSGSGKDLFADMLYRTDKSKYHDKSTMMKISSYTTRPMRTGETMGEEHIFLTEMPEYEKGEVFAHLKYGGYDYWTTETQMRKSDRNIYVLDEESIKQLIERSQLYKATIENHPIPPEGHHRWAWLFDVITILIKRDNVDVGSERTTRDSERNFDGIKWDFEVDNNGSIEELSIKAQNIHESIMRRKPSWRKKTK